MMCDPNSLYASDPDHYDLRGGPTQADWDRDEYAEDYAEDEIHERIVREHGGEG